MGTKDKKNICLGVYFGRGLGLAINAIVKLVNQSVNLLTLLGSSKIGCKIGCKISFKEVFNRDVS